MIIKIISLKITNVHIFDSTIKFGVIVVKQTLTVVENIILVIINVKSRGQKLSH